MKSPMRTSLPDPRIALSSLILFAAGACRGLSFPAGGMRDHPAALVGQWVDSAKSTAADTSLWLLDGAGNDGSQHIRRLVDEHGNTGPFAPTTARHFGYWFFRGTLQDTSDRAVCFTNRPGRSAPTCRPVAFDSVSTRAGMRRRLVVRSYQGAHSIADRVLLERVP